MKIKLCLIGKRDWMKVNDLTGEEIKKTFYQAFDEKGKAMEFQSVKDDYQIHETLKYLPDLSEEFDLKAVFDSFKGKMKYVDISEEGLYQSE
jgi:hypothetical protein